jgi:DNA-binding HxlR family transcriptional regulator
MARAMEVVGDRWSILILREAYYGVKRFDEFEYYIGIAPNILSTRLKKLIDAGVMTRVPLPEHAGRYEYVLTEKGRDFFQPISRLRNGVTTGWRSPQGRRSCSANAPPDDRSNIRHCGRAAASRCGSRMSRSLPAQVLFHSTASDLVAMPPIVRRPALRRPFHDASANNARLVSIRIRFARYSAEA